MSGTAKASVGECTEILSGFAFNSKQFGDGGDLPIIRIRDIVRGYSETFYNGDFDPKFTIYDGDILIGMDGEFNRAKWKGGEALLNQRVCRISSNTDQLDSSYLFHFLPPALKKIEDETPFVTVKHLSVKKIRDIEIPLPSLEEQRRIAGILDKAEALRAKRRAALNLLASLSQSIFLEMFGDPVANPMEWPVKNSGSLFAVPPRIGTTIPARGTGVLVVRVGEVGSSQIAFGKCGRVEIPDKDFEKFKLEEGDVIIARAIGSKNQLGKASLFLGHGEPVVIDSHVMRMRPDKTECDPVWFYSFLSSDRGKLILQKAGGATAVQFNINAKQAASLKIPVPPLKLQQQFADRILSLEKLKAAHRKSLAELDALFASLQDRAFKGELGNIES
ncbi:Type-1 restriction enzyme EcoKI specificity protein [Pontiella desulfatans]|uniref:Type-1 restriction enzyme EcoKI specificity protein n=1 Tax=Pontiella desulfatans TaxID=2750659 RepID=A0A6C2U576_PONDE|nr:restriction endonuclease subunit S [Pontiella desulfatans]VGO15033.1 Type-1 restriction enzyme EcoKI specificity protein [Pontiella desulfatans]